MYDDRGKVSIATRHVETFHSAPHHGIALVSVSKKWFPRVTCHDPGCAWGSNQGVLRLLWVHSGLKLNWSELVSRESLEVPICKLLVSQDMYMWNCHQTLSDIQTHFHPLAATEAVEKQKNGQSFF